MRKALGDTKLKLLYEALGREAMISKMGIPTPNKRRS